MEIRNDEKFYEEMLILSIQEIITRKMVERAMTKRELSQILNYDPQYLQQLFSGARGLTIPLLSKILFKLDCRLEVKDYDLT